MGAPPSWGGQELLDQLEQLVEVTGSAIEPGVYLVNATLADKINHGAASPPRPLSPKIEDHSLQETAADEQEVTLGRGAGADSPTQQPGAATGPITVAGMRRRRSASGHRRDQSNGSPHRGGSPPRTTAARSQTQLPFENLEPLVDVVREIRWNILERFSQVARFSRDAATNILDHPITKTILPPHVQQRIQDSEAAKRMMDDYDSARVYLAKWAATVADQGDREMERIHGSSSMGKRRINDHEDEEGPLGAFNVLDVCPLYQMPVLSDQDAFTMINCVLTLSYPSYP